MMMIAPNSRARKKGEENMEKFKGRSRVMPNMGNGAILSATCCIMGNRGSVGIGHERFENSDSIYMFANNK